MALCCREDGLSSNTPSGRLIIGVTYEAATSQPTELLLHKPRATIVRRSRWSEMTATSLVRWHITFVSRLEATILQIDAPSGRYFSALDGRVVPLRLRDEITDPADSLMHGDGAVASSSVPPLSGLIPLDP